MTRTVKKLFACVLALAMLFSVVLPGLAKNGPYVPEEEGGWNYARLELVELDENGEPITVPNEEYGYPENKAVKLYADGKATPQDGAVYDLASNTLTLTNFKGNYELKVNLMGDDFTLCVKGECSLAGIRVNGGGVITPPWSCGLRITGDGTLTVNADKKLDSGILFQPQDDNAYLTVDKEVTLNVSGKKVAIEVYGFVGTFTFTIDGEARSVAVQPAQREVSKTLDGYSNPLTMELALCNNAADPTGIYTINTVVPSILPDGADEPIPDPDKPPYVAVERYLYIESLDAYVYDHDWKHENATTVEGPDEVRFDNMEAAAAAGFTPVLDEESKQKWITVNYFANTGSENIYQDAEGHEYAVGYGPDDEGHYGTIAMTITPIAEFPGKYVFTYAKGVDPETLTKIIETKTFDDMFDYLYPGTEFTHEGETSVEYVTLDRIDVTVDESAFPWGEEITAEQMFDLFAETLFKVETKGVYLRFRRVTETGTGKYQTLPITASKLFSDNPFVLFAADQEYAVELTFFAGTDAESGNPIRFADETSLYVNGKKISSGAPLAADVDGMIVKGDIVLSAGTYKKPAEVPQVMLGDVDKDTKITAGDARLALRRAVDLEDYAEGSYEFIACDVDKDGKVTANDARSILRAAVDLEDPATWQTKISRAESGEQRAEIYPEQRAEILL